MQRYIASLTLALAATTANVTSAHHSYAMFDAAKEITIEGVVKEFQWTNPHIWIQVMVNNRATGKVIEWSIEGGSPNALARKGWKRTVMKPGDKVSVTIHPLKDGTAGGAFVSATVNGVPHVGWVSGEPEANFASEIRQPMMAWSTST